MDLGILGMRLIGTALSLLIGMMLFGLGDMMDEFPFTVWCGRIAGILLPYNAEK